jgi:mannose-6-phosphate isomerase-like protein (cupin superfamily)
MIERIMNGDRLLAIIVSKDFRQSGVHFLTREDASLQLAVMCHPKAKVIEPHVHNSLPRRVEDTQEALILRKGRLRVDFYDDGQTYLESRVVEGGDVLILVSGAHGFEVLEDVEMIEAKTGPYLRDEDKRRFRPVSQERVTIKG